MKRRDEQTWVARNRESIAIGLGAATLLSQVVGPFFGYPANLSLVGAGVTLLTGGVLFDAMKQK